MKFAVSFIVPAVALRVADVHPTVNMVLTNDGSLNADAASLRQLVKSSSHASLAEVSGDFHQPNVVRINYESPHAMLVENILRESVSADAPYEEGEIGLNLIPAGASAASLKSLMAKTDTDFENEFHAGLHASLLQAIRIRLPKGGFKEGSSLISDDGRIAVRVLPARSTPGGFNQLADKIEATGEESESAVAQFLNLFEQGKVSKQQLKDSGAISRCANVLKSDGSSDAMISGCGSVITHLTNTPVASSRMNSATGGAGHVSVVLPSPSRVYGA